MTATIVISGYETDRKLSDYAFELGEKVVGYSISNDRVGDLIWTIIARACRERVLWREEHGLEPILPAHREYTLQCRAIGEHRTVREPDLKAAYKRLAEVATDA